MAEICHNCDICDENFQALKALYCHARAAHSLKALFKCNYCTSSFCLRQNLEKHEDRHKSEDVLGPVRCKNCTEVFSCIVGLSGHNQSVHGSRPVVLCPHCKKVFRKDNLERHISTVHLCRRAFKCPECHVAFSQKHSLQTHERVVHQKEHSFMCSECGRNFSRKDQLNHHMKAIHLEVRPHVCPLCGKAYTLRGALKRHASNVHGQPAYRCELCGDGFGKRRDLSEHHCSA